MENYAVNNNTKIYLIALYWNAIPEKGKRKNQIIQKNLIKCIKVQNQSKHC